MKCDKFVYNPTEDKNMDVEELKTLQEKENYELKAARKGLPANLYETYSSFCNTSGGTIFLGVKEVEPGHNEIVGVENPEQEIKDLFNTLRNRSKVSACYLKESDVEKLSVEGKTVLAIHVEEAPRKEKPVYLNGNLSDSYLRGHEGDYRASQNEIRAMLLDNGTESYDALPNALSFGMEAIRLESLHAYREEMNARKPANIYRSLNDEDFLSALALLRKDKDGKTVLTNAAVLMFTNFSVISALFPSYSLDYVEAPSFSDKWSHRIASDDALWSGNMYDFFSMVVQRVTPYLPNPYVPYGSKVDSEFTLEDALKEAIVNELSNYAFTLAGGARILYTGQSLIFRNTGRVLVGVPQALKGGINDPRNKAISILFRHVSASDRAGTGIPRIFQCFKAYGLEEPLLSESASPEMTTLALPLEKKKEETRATKITEEEVLDYLAKKGKEEGVSVSEISEAFSVHRATASKILNQLLSEGKVRTNGLSTSRKRFLLL